MLWQLLDKNLFKYEAWLVLPKSMLSINSDGLESPKPFKLRRAVARSQSVRPYAVAQNVLIVLYLSVVGGDVRTDSALLAVLVSNAATTW
ncbi:hypothetical protein PoB_000548600 [Plakobranchus ocellatus]|uniref:Uncharacterized protein n=1 Tax=Plakobranchus ocellatus TaxID=259542 RepID=A0AAV3XVG1_9GAST|nr:hypothetical protein PoB_000548600 [Plakobranchus ocellatus]